MFEPKVGDVIYVWFLNKLTAYTIISFEVRSANTIPFYNCIVVDSNGKKKEEQYCPNSKGIDACWRIGRYRALDLSKLKKELKKKNIIF